MKTKPPILRLLKKSILLAILALTTLPAITMAQSLTGVNPDSGLQGQTLELMVSGQNTNFTQATYVSVNLQQGTSSMIFPFSVTVENDQLIKAVFNFSYAHNPGSYDLAVFSYPQVPMFFEDAFDLLPGPNPPEITGIEPETAETGQTLDITISGQYTHFQASSTTVWFNQGSATIYPNYNEAISNSQIASNFTFQYYHPEGFYDVNTYNETDGHLTLMNGFFLSSGPMPSITSLQPAQGMAGTYIEFQITGENTHFQDATEVVAFIQNNYGGVGLQVEILNNQNMTASLILPYSLGNNPNTNYYLYVFTNLDGPMFLYNAFTAMQNPVQPYLSNIEPASTYLGNTVILEAYAENTFFTWSQYLSVWLQKNDWNNPVINADNFVIENDEKLNVQFTIPSQVENSGLWDFIVFDDISGEMILEGGFTVIDTITNIHERIVKHDFRVFPNPVSDHVNIISPENFENCTVGIFNLAGQQMDIKKIKFETGIPVRLNVEQFPEGIYTIKIITQSDIIVEKIIKN